MGEEWIREAKNGNQEAMAQLLYSNYEFLYKFLIKLTFNASLAEDLVQEAMVRAIEKFYLYDAAKSKFSTWLITIAQNLYLDYLRKNKRIQFHGEEDQICEVQAEETAGTDDSWQRVVDALKVLPETIRIPIVLKHYYGYSLEEIADIMSIPLGTVKSRIHNGLKTLRKELEPHEGK